MFFVGKERSNSGEKSEPNQRSNLREKSHSPLYYWDTFKGPVSVSESTESIKLGSDLLLCDTLTINLESITQLTFYSLANLTGQADFAISCTLHVILCEVVVANSRQPIVNNSVALLIVFESKLLAEFDGIEEVSDVHTTGTLSRAQFQLPENFAAVNGIGCGLTCDSLRTLMATEAKTIKTCNFICKVV